MEKLWRPLSLLFMFFMIPNGFHGVLSGISSCYYLPISIFGTAGGTWRVSGVRGREIHWLGLLDTLGELFR